MKAREQSQPAAGIVWDGHAPLEKIEKEMV